MLKKIIVSIVIVHYKVERELLMCIDSIIKSRPKVIYEIIIVDNDEKKTIEKNFKNKFPGVIYIKSSNNIGFGAGNNLGVKNSRGDFLFFLNPDTEIFSGAIDRLVDFIKKNTDAAIVAPLFLDKNNKPYPLQGSKKLTVLRGIFTLSFLHKLLPNNRIAKEYLLSDWNKTDIKEVDVVPGTGFVIRRDIFREIGGFDENFFLYFEEFDLCNRVKKLGYKIYIVPEAKVKHLWEVSTKRAGFDIKKIFQKSRFYYFKKYNGLIPALIVEVFTRLNKVQMLLIAILALGMFLRLYRLQELMPFIGDQGWFYLSARDMILTGKIPLIGITASHTWLHQGPLWTYMLGLILWLFHFNPVSGAYFSAFLGIITILILYITCSTMFSRNAAVVAVALYATSPLIVFHSRFAYHTSPIPLFALLFILFLYKWIKGKNIYFPLIIFTLSILYNLELATVSLWLALVGILVYGFWTKKKWLANIYNKKIIIFTIIIFFPMLPILIYDFNHGFPQTLGFGAWIGYRALGFLTNKSNLAISFLYSRIQRLLFLENGGIALLLFFSSIFYFFYSIYQMYKNKKYNVGHILVAYIFIISGISLLINKTPSDAYLPVLFTLLIIILALLIYDLTNKKYFYIGILLLILIMSINSYSVVNDYKRTKIEGLTFSARIRAAQKIVKYADSKEYNLVGKGWLGEFENYIMNYKYLTWWMGNAPVKDKSMVKIYVTEEPNKIIIEKNIKTEE